MKALLMRMTTGRVQQAIATGFMLTLAFIVVSPAAFGDVTGHVSFHIGALPQTTTNEISSLHFDLQSDVTTTLTVSGLAASLHTHFGLAGIEDAILSFNATLGAFDILSEFVFARFPAATYTPADLRFVNKQFGVELALGGFTLGNTLWIEDTGWPQSSALAVGDLIKIQGQTTSGVTITSKTGICLDPAHNKIKKHVLGDVTVSPDCATQPLPNLLFSFERFSVEGIPWAPGITSDVFVECFDVTSCDFNKRVSVGSGFIPFSVETDWNGLFQLEDITLTFSPGLAELTMQLQPDGTLDWTIFRLYGTLNPDQNPASFSTRAFLVPGKGLETVTTDFQIIRDNLEMNLTTVFSDGPPIGFTAVVFDAIARIGAVEVHARSTFTPEGLDRGDVWTTVRF